MKPTHLFNLILVLAMLLSAAPTARTAEPTNEEHIETHPRNHSVSPVKETVPSSRETSMTRKTIAQQYAIPNFSSSQNARGSSLASPIGANGPNPLLSAGLPGVARQSERGNSMRASRDFLNFDRDRSYDTADQSNKVGTISHFLQEDDNNDACIFPDFSSVTGLTRNGDAKQFIHKLRLTPAEEYQVGSAWCNNKQLIQHGFKTTFQFQILAADSGRGDGLAFVVQNDSISALGDPAGGIGYSGITNSLAVEFDTWFSAGLEDPDINHISVHTRGTDANSSHHDYSLGSTTYISDMSDDQVHTATIEYVSGTMRIFLDSSPVLTVSVDLSTTLSLDSGTAWVGFTAATGDRWEKHDILNWAFYPAFDLSVNKSGSADAVEIYTNLTYAITVTNNGPVETTGVVLTDTLPLSITFGLDPVVPSQGDCETGTPGMPYFICNLGDLGPGAAAMVTATVIPTAVGTITNTASVVGNETDPSPNNNTAIATTLIPVPPVASFTAAPRHGKAPLTVTFTDTSTGCVTSRLWTFGPLDYSQQPNPTRTYDEIGVYTVTLAVECHDLYSDVLPRSNYITATPNHPPQALAVTIVPTAPTDYDDLTLSYRYNDPDDDPEDETQTERRWNRNGKLQSKFNDKGTIPNSVTHLGETWCATVHPHDGTVPGAVAESNCVIIGPVDNGLPQALNPTITPSQPDSDDNLTLSYKYDDPENDDEGDTQIRWYRGKDLQPAFNDQIRVPGSDTMPGQTWYATVRPHDGQDYGLLVRAMPVSVTQGTNTPPEVCDVRIIPTRPCDDSDLSLDYDYRDVDGDLEGTSQIHWYKNREFYATSPGQTVITAGLTALGDVWHAFVTPHDGQVYGAPVAAHSVTVQEECGNTPPEALNVFLSPGQPGDDDHLELNYVYHDADDDLEGETKIQWTLDATPHITYADLTVVPADATSVDDVWCASVTPHDGEDSGQVIQSNNCVTVTLLGGNTPPEARHVHIAPERPRPSDPMQLHYTYFDVDNDSEGDTLIFWHMSSTQPVSSTLQPAYNNKTIVPAGAALRGERWFATVQVHDGVYPGTTVTTPEVLINRLPQAQNVLVQPPEPASCCQTCLLSYDHDDDDDDPPDKPQIRWYCDGGYQPDYDDKECLPASATSPGQVWYATLAPYDGYEYGCAVESNAVTIPECEPPQINIYLPIVLRNYPGHQWDEFYEENDERKYAYGPLLCDQTYDAYPDDLDDWYYLVLTETTSIHVQVTNCITGGQLLVYSPQKRIGHDGRGKPTLESPNELEPNALKDLPPDTYHIRVYTPVTSTVQFYHLTVACEPSVPKLMLQK